MSIRTQTHNIDIKQGTDFALAIRIKGADGQPEDLTGRTFRGQIRSSYDADAPAATFQFTNRDQTTEEGKGMVDMKLPNTALAQADLKLSCKAVYVYDVEQVFPSGQVKMVMQGQANIYPEATR